MGVNITAIIPLKNSNHIKKAIELIENGKIKEINTFYNATIQEGFVARRFQKAQWFKANEEVREKPKIISLDIPLEIPEGLVFRFHENAIEIWSYFRAHLFIKHFPKSKKTLIEVHQKIGKLLGARECWLMGDVNSICYSFRDGENFKQVAKNEIEKKSLDELYVKIDEEGTYDIVGFYKMKID